MAERVVAEVRKTTDIEAWCQLFTSMMYSFITLDADQQQLRRELLDKYGLTAQISVVLPLLFLQASFLITRLNSRRSGQTPSSPVHKSRRTKHGRGVRDLTLLISKFLWWCGDDVAVLGIDLGTRGRVIGSTLWTSWLVLLCFVQTGDDYLHLTKRFGIVAASQLPFHYLLAIKTPYSPLQYLTHASHETLNAIHQTLGRIVTVLMYAHVVLYLNFYIQSGLLAAKLQEAYVVCGVVAIILFTIIGTSSLGVVRRANYRTFLVVHIVLSGTVLPILAFHVSHIRIYVFETLAVILLNVALRAWATQSYTTADIRLVPGTQLIDISIPLENISTAVNWMAGQHAYISLPGKAVTAAVTKNPFTLSSVPTLDHRIRFVARIQSGNTTALAAAASSGKSTHELLIEGPYGVATHPDALLSSDRILLIAGGIGSTFIMPLYRQLLADLSPSKGSYRRQRVSAIWIARSLADINWALPQDQSEKEAIFERLRVFITGPDDSRLPQDGSPALYDVPTRTDVEDMGIELQERANLLTASEESPDSTPGTAAHIIAGRPDLGRLVDQAFSGGASERVAVVVCGPKSLGAAVRQEIARWIHKDRIVWFWNESFDL